MDKIHTHALNSYLPHQLYYEPSIGPQLLDALTQVKELNISKHARTVMTMFEKVLVPMLHNINNLRKIEQVVDAKETFVKESWDLVRKADNEITNWKAVIDEVKAHITLKQ